MHPCNDEAAAQEKSVGVPTRKRTVLAPRTHAKVNVVANEQGALAQALNRRNVRAARIAPNESYELRAAS